MTAVFDTLAAARGMEEAGLTREAAEAVADAVRAGGAGDQERHDGAALDNGHACGGQSGDDGRRAEQDARMTPPGSVADGADRRRLGGQRKPSLTRFD